MADINREIQELLADYAGALRDGSILDYLKSLTREEAARIHDSRDFWDAAEMTNVMNGVAFGQNLVVPDINLFISRVNAGIAQRKKKARATSRHKKQSRSRYIKKLETE